MAGIINNAIDLSRPKLQNPDGSFSTERTITIEMDGKHYLVPTIVGGQAFDPEVAIKLFKDGKNHAVGVFNSAEEADAAAVARSAEIGRLRK
jgi:hypothetical protein